MKNDTLYLQFPDNINSRLHHTTEGTEVQIQENTDQKKLRIGTLFTQVEGWYDPLVCDCVISQVK